MKPYLVIGLGETGEAVLAWCALQGWPVRVTDTRENLPQLQRLQQQYTNFEWCIGSRFCDADGFLNDELLSDVGGVVVSPGLSLHYPPISKLVTLAKQQNIPILGEVELFAQALRQLKTEQSYHPKVIAITGTNGKTTVTALTAHLIAKSGKSVVKAGNISPSVLTALIEACQTQSLPEVWVLELSSFQLATTQTLSVDVGMILNITEDHLNWHLDMEDYIQAKMRLVSMSQQVVVPRDDSLLMPYIASSLKSPKFRTFAVDSPLIEHDLGMSTVQGLRWLEVAYPVEEPQKKTGRKAAEVADVRKEGALKQLMPTPALPLKGKHNVLNVMASFLACRCLDIPWNTLLRDVLEYHGEPHRVEFVRSVRGVDFYDDSKGTNVGATVAAVTGLEAPVHLILGGDGKGQSFEPLVQPILKYAKGLYIIGKDQTQIAKTFAGVSIPVECCQTLEQAVQLAFNNAQPGEMVLLSPACASWDMFRDYAHRAQCFIKEVESLALEAGEVL